MNGVTQRRLAAIVAADVVAYSRLMAEDEAGTLAAMRRHRTEIWEPVTKAHGGRVVGTAGDSTLLEFQSAVAAVASSLAVQRDMTHQNAGIDEARRIRFRVGISLGEVVIEGDDIFGDGVNIAARLEALAAPDGICVSDDVMRQVRGKLEVEFRDGGEQRLKNIAHPVRVWHWPAAAAAAATAGAPAAARPAKPSIAVLPFDNLSNDPDQDYFCDGMVEDIITGLSRYDQLLVLARNTTFTYKGRAVDVRQVAKDLGVVYVLEGSVRKAGQRVRITGQLIDAESGAHIWADRFDGDMADVFELQDRITEAVVGVIEPSIRKTDLERARRKAPENMDAYDLYLQALPLAYMTRQETCAKAFQLLEQAIVIDPGFAPALALSAWCLEIGIVRNWPPLTENDRALGEQRGRSVLSVDADDANAIAMAGFAVQMISLDFDTGRAAAMRALGLNPNSVIVRTFAGLTLMFGGEAKVARECFEKAMVLSPADPGGAIFLVGLSMVLLMQGNLQAARQMAAQSLALNTREASYWCVVAANVGLGEIAAAKVAFDALVAHNPRAASRDYWEGIPTADPNLRRLLTEAWDKVAGVA